MNIPNATLVLQKIAAGDQRTVGEADILFWADVLPDHIELEDALKGITYYFRRSRDRIMPADVIIEARRARCHRLGERMWFE
jgi:hypothetical protein